MAGIAGATVALALLSGAELRAQAAPHASHAQIRAIPFAVLQRPLPRRSGIGTAHEPVTTSSPEAQAWYDEGLAHLHSFVWIDAARAFNAALRADARLAMAHLGLSFAFGGLGSLQEATAELGRARALEAAAGDRDRLRIALRGRQLAALTSPDPARAAEYRSALDRALATYPADVELLLLRGEIEVAADGPAGMSSGEGAVPFYARAQRAAPNAFAPRHFLAHAYENAGRVDLALQESQAYAKMAPAVAHAHHMLGHGLRRSGRPVEAIAEFRKADDIETAYFKSDQIPPEYNWHHHHNQSLLASTYRYIGQMRTAAALLRAAFALPALLLTEELDKRDLPALLLARGSAAEALRAAQQLTKHGAPIVRAAGHLAAAHAQMAAGRLPAAGLESDAALRELRAGGPEASVLAPDLRLTQGEFFLRGGDRGRGRSMIREAVESLRARPGPDAWSQTLFTLEAAARAARSAGDQELASELAEQMRQHDPAYAGTSFALALAAEQRGDRPGARRAYAEAVRRWQGADADHSDLAFARRQLASLP